jgi:hypothetical protein
MTKKRFRPSARRSMSLCLLLASGIATTQLEAQAIAGSLPDSPGTTLVDSDNSSSSSLDQAQQPATTPPEHQDLQTKRILGIIPNFRAVSANVHLPPQTVKDKFVTASEDTFDYSAILLPALLAGEAQLENSTPEFHQGAAGYGRYFWHTFTDQSIENYMVEFIVPAATREDTRYYTLGSGGFLKRAGYSLSRVVVTRNDRGTDTFNFGEVVGAGAAAGISNLYYPSPERTAGKTLDKWALNVGIDAGTFMFKEFWPDINHHLFHPKTPMVSAATTP